MSPFLGKPRYVKYITTISGLSNRQMPPFYRDLYVARKDLPQRTVNGANVKYKFPKNNKAPRAMELDMFGDGKKHVLPAPSDHMKFHNLSLFQRALNFFGLLK